MSNFTQRMPERLHAALRDRLASDPLLSQNDLVNEAVARYLGLPDEYTFVQPTGLADLTALGYVSGNDARRLKRMVRSAGRLVVVGPTASGRTTLVRALLHEYQSDTGSPRRALVHARFAGDGYAAEKPLSLVFPRPDQSTRHGLAQAFSGVLSAEPPGFDAVFVDAVIEPDERAALIAGLKAVRKRGVAVAAIVDGLGHRDRAVAEEFPDAVVVRTSAHAPLEILSPG